MAALRAYPRLAVLTAMVHDETSGEVDVDGDGRPVIRYAMNEPDRRQLAKGLVACARLLLAAGAVEVTIPAIPPLRFTSASQLEGVDTSNLRPHSVPLTAVHPMGTLRMGEDPKTERRALDRRAPPAPRPVRGRRVALPDEHRGPAADQHLRLRAAPGAATSIDACGGADERARFSGYAPGSKAVDSGHHDSTIEDDEASRSDHSPLEARRGQGGARRGGHHRHDALRGEGLRPNRRPQRGLPGLGLRRGLRAQGEGRDRRPRRDGGGVIDAIENAAKTNKIGDGKIFVFDVPEAVRIRTGEHGEPAL